MATAEEAPAAAAERPAVAAGTGAPPPVEAAAAAAAVVAVADDEKGRVHPDELIQAPRWGPLRVLSVFLGFGITAFGGPVAQINMMKQEFVVEGGWITPTRFNRVFALYQMLPGPEATELACYFGMLAGGRLGGLLGGLGFILPGFLLMLLFAWSYERFGAANDVYRSVFLGLQPAVAAMVFRAAHKIGEHAFHDPLTKLFDWRLALVGFLAALESVLSVNFFVTKLHLALVYYCLLQLPPTAPAWRAAWKAAAAAAVLAPLAVFIGVIAAKGRLDELLPMGVGVARTLGNSFLSQYIIGLVGGLVTFGGAYTAIPFIQVRALS